MRHVRVLRCFAAGMVGITAFQAAAALGAPVGAFTQGGRHPRSLPPMQRAAATASAVACLGLVVAALDHAGDIDVLPEQASGPAMRGACAFLALNTIANAASTSPAERRVMTPISLVLAVLAGWAGFSRG